MELKRATELIQSEPFIDSAVDPIKDVANQILDGDDPTRRTIRNALFGTWLGHPFHPVIVTIPTGSWVLTGLFDLLGATSGDDGYDRAADVTAGVGLAGAVLAAASGINDWRFTSGRPGRLGLVHGLTNVVAVVLMGASLLLRLLGARNSGRALGAVGIAVMTAAAYVGGELVYGERIGVSYVSTEKLPRDFVAVMLESELAEGVLRGAKVKGKPIVLLRRGDRIYALAATCSHMGGPLQDGTLSDTCVTCPWHGSTFSMETGRVVDGPASFPQPVLETRLRDGQIEVRLAPESS